MTEDEKEEIVARRLLAMGDLLKRMERLSGWLVSLIVLFSLLLLVMCLTGAILHQGFTLTGLFLGGFLLPLYLFNLLVVSSMKEGVRYLEENGPRLAKPAVPRRWPRVWWLFNLAPPAALVLCMGQMTAPEMLARLGGGCGPALALLALSATFIKHRAAAGFFLNTILGCFVLVSYVLPYMGPASKESARFLSILESADWIGITLGTFFLAGYPLVKKAGVFFSPQIIKLVRYWQVPAHFGIIGNVLSRLKFHNDPCAFLGFQILGWLALYLLLLWAERRRKLDFEEIKNYISKDRGLQPEVSRKAIWINFGLLLAVSALCESFRGLWLPWGLTSLWMGLIFVNLWKIWKYAFPPS